MEITTMIGCSLMCNFCPQDNLRDMYGNDVKYMSLDTFKTALSKVPKNTRIDFSGMAEAWINPAATDMLEHALVSGHNVAIYTTFYNWNIETAERVIKLLYRYRAQIEVLSVHFPDEYGNMRGWKYSTEWEAVFHDRAGSLNKEQVKEQPVNFITRHERPVSCSKTANYDQHVLLPNGDVVLCCMDYDLKHVIGNLVRDSYDDLYTGSPMVNLIRENMKSCYSAASLCKSCTDAKIH
jgi:sulfatase maturation enzyme AslB (radical SAM superfamily)